MSHDNHLYGKGPAPKNVLASNAAPMQNTSPVAPKLPVKNPSRAPMPVADGSSQSPQMGDKQKIVAPPAHAIAASRAPAPENNDRTSGMVSAMSAEADRLHPVKGR